MFDILSFQNNLSQLSTQAIQMFLDELTFRECFGHYPLICFNAMLDRLANQTKAAVKARSSFSVRSKQIITNPFDDWRVNKAPDVSIENNISSTNISSHTGKGLSCVPMSRLIEQKPLVEGANRTLNGVTIIRPLQQNVFQSQTPPANNIEIRFVSQVQNQTSNVITL